MNVEKKTIVGEVRGPEANLELLLDAAEAALALLHDVAFLDPDSDERVAAVCADLESALAAAGRGAT